VNQMPFKIPKPTEQEQSGILAFFANVCAAMLMLFISLVVSALVLFTVTSALRFVAWILSGFDGGIPFTELL
jgi:hypothetical protein